MNYLKFQVLGGLLVCLCLLGCNQSPKKTGPTTNQENPEDKMTQQEQANFVDAPKEIIGNDEAKKMFDAYWGEEGPKEGETQFVYFDYQTIKDYIAYVDQEAREAGNVKVNSLRIYFAKNPDSNKNTLFMLPTTRFEGMEYDQGFYIENQEGQKVAAPIKKENSNGNGMGSIEDQKAKNYASMVPNVITAKPVMQSGGSLTMNRGGTGPPPDNDY